ncbi:hypothetical protein SDC9_133848 [bioreactor metagenome]|uniref:Uncharacterized protein n=1 Tax=bioreactor metagenome TaxID=1076179 RepID=A0A645DBE4_9ZZZZ
MAAVPAGDRQAAPVRAIVLGGGCHCRVLAPVVFQFFTRFASMNAAFFYNFPSKNSTQNRKKRTLALKGSFLHLLQKLQQHVVEMAAVMCGAAVPGQNLPHELQALGHIVRGQLQMLRL